jgi:hypothetical protein
LLPSISGGVGSQYLRARWKGARSLGWRWLRPLQPGARGRRRRAQLHPAFVACRGRRVAEVVRQVPHGALVARVRAEPLRRIERVGPTVEAAPAGQLLPEELVGVEVARVLRHRALHVDERAAPIEALCRSARDKHDKRCAWQECAHVWRPPDRVRRNERTNERRKCCRRPTEGARRSFVRRVRAPRAGQNRVRRTRRAQDKLGRRQKARRTQAVELYVDGV